MPKAQPYWPTIESVDANGIVAVDRLGIVFFLDREVCANPSGVVRAFDDFIRGIGRDHARFYLDGEGDMHPLPSNHLAALQAELVEPLQRGESGGFFLVEPTKAGYREVAHCFCDLSDRDKPPEERVALWFRLPQETLAAQGPDAALAFALRLAEHLPFSYGYVNPVLTCEESFLTALPYLRRYPGLDVAHADSAAMDIDDRPLGVYWVNLFGPRLCAQLGGVEALRAALPAAVQVVPAGQGGACVVLGPQPQIGDSNAQTALALHRQLALILQGHLHVPTVVYFTDADELADPDAQAAWHNRFLDDDS